jgi:TonB family protein
MIRLRIICLVMLLVTMRAGWGQANAGALEQELKGKQLALRSYSAESVARYEWVDDKLVVVPGHLFTVGVFKTRSVKLRGGVLVISGDRLTLVRDSTKNSFSLTGGDPMQLEINLHGATPAVAIPRLKEMLFVEDVNAAIAGLPAPLPEMLPFDVGSEGRPAGCNCVWISKDGHWIEVANKDPLYAHPKVIYQEEPEFSEEARRAKVGGAVRLTCYVDDAGRVGDIWIARPLGYGLNEKAVRSLQHYKFAPAQYDAKAVGTALSIEINYQIF